jgi:hypothetical protein
MSSTASTTDRGHPITVAAAHIHEGLDKVVEQSTWSMGDQETRDTLCEVTRAIARMQELELRVAAHAEANRVGDESGATSTAVWWANRTRMTKAEAQGKVKQAQALDTDRAPVREALAQGEVLADQARVIVRAVHKLPDGVDPATVAKAERVLLGYAKDYDAKALNVLGRRILHVVAPEVGEAHEAKLLEKEEEAARSHRSNAAWRVSVSHCSYSSCVHPRARTRLS